MEITPRWRALYFYPRPPGGGRQERRAQNGKREDFYPRPPGGGRRYDSTVELMTEQFLSTPSGWRATPAKPTPKPSVPFLSTPSGWRATDSGVTDEIDFIISIHALRVEGDQKRNRCADCADISIHALRVEGDRRPATPASSCPYFYPRPPGGGRQQKRTKFSSVFAQKGEEFASLRRGKRKICRWCFKKDKFWVLIWCEGSGKSVCASASHCG